MERNIEELRANGSLDRVLKTGQKAPSFALQDQHGLRVSSADLLAKGPLVVSFYRGTWCPFCNEELAALAEAYPRFREFGADLVVITPQSVTTKPYRSEHALPFSMLSDEDGSVEEAFGLSSTFPAYLSDLYKNVFGNDLSAINADGAWKLPIPARFVIARDGTILDVQTDADYRYRPDPKATLAVLQRESAKL